MAGELNRGEEWRIAGLGMEVNGSGGLRSTVTREARAGFVEGHKETVRSYYTLAHRSASLAQRT